MFARLRFLFTGTVWHIQEECDAREADCSNCGAGLWHASSSYLTKREALDNAKDFVEQMSDGEIAIVQAQDEGNDFMVFTASRLYAAHVYKTKF